jgi:hypothetical protein
MSQVGAGPKSRAIDDNVKTAESRHGLGDCAFTVFLLPDIAGIRDSGAPANSGQLFASSIEECLAATHHHNAWKSSEKVRWSKEASRNPVKVIRSTQCCANNTSVDGVLSASQAAINACVWVPA